MSEKRLQLDSGSRWPERVTVMGAARSGIAAARYFITKGTPVFISDTCSGDKLENVLRNNNMEEMTWEAGGHTERVLDSDLIVLSPGIESDLPVLNEARSRNIPVWSEMELGFQASVAPFFAVTGSTGKSTTVSMVGAALEAAGIEHVVAGNIGTPVVNAAPQISENGFVIAEVSSFQLETIEWFSPRAAVVMNLMKNHLDRYRSEQDYYNAKKNIARNMGKDQMLILNANDQMLRDWGDEIAERTNVIYFGADVPEKDALWFEDSDLYCRQKSSVTKIGTFSDMHLPGKHNLENAAVASFLAKLAGASDADLVRGICQFKGLPHRLEYVTAINGVKCYNDSKSTTAESVACAVEAFPRGVHLIAGGKDKGCDYSVVTKNLEKNVKSVTLIGETAERIKEEWKTVIAAKIVRSLEEAIHSALENAVEGEAVVFSPGCSSFDMFRNYEDRGEQFRLIVKQINGYGASDNE